VICWLLIAAMLPSESTLAASDVQLKHAPDGTLVVVGSGWHRGKQLVVSLGQQAFDVRADASGDFELATGMASYQGELSIHHAEANTLAFIPLAVDVPNPLAVLFAWSVVEGLALLGIVVGLWLVAAGVTRRWRAGRYPR